MMCPVQPRPVYHVPVAVFAQVKTDSQLDKFAGPEANPITAILLYTIRYFDGPTKMD